MPQKLSAMQAAAILLLCRLAAFFCCGAAYTSAYAFGMAAAAALQTVLVLPLLRLRQARTLPKALHLLCRIYAFAAAAYLFSQCFDLLKGLHMPYPLLTAGFLLAALGYTLLLPAEATPRTAVLLLILAAAGFLLLPISGVGTARLLHLYLPDRFSDAFLREFRSSSEFALLPLMLSKESDAKAPRHTLLIYGIGRIIVLPLAVLLGAMQNGRLTQWQGNPFFLLLARTPLSDAVRTDGFWMLLAVSCGLLAVTWFSQNTLPLTQKKKKAVCILLPLLAIAAALMYRFRYEGEGIGIAAAILSLLCTIRLCRRPMRGAYHAA